MRAFCVNIMIMPMDIWVRPYIQSALHFAVKLRKLILRNVKYYFNNWLSSKPFWFLYFI